MKKLHVILFILLLPYFSYGQITNSSDTEKAKALIQGSFDDLWSDFDTTKINLYHTDNFILLEHGEIWTNDTIQNYMVRSLKSNQKAKRINTIDFISVEQRGDIIWLAYHNYAKWIVDGKENGKMHWLESAVAIKTDQGWRLTMLHSTRVQNH